MDVLPAVMAGIEQAGEPPSLTYAVDFNCGRIIGRVDGLAAMRQAIRKALITPRFHCLIYNSQYGSEISDTLTAGDASPAYIEAELPRLIKEALLADSRVLRVYGFSFAFSGDAALIAFSADTIFGPLDSEVSFAIV